MNKKALEIKTITLKENAKGVLKTSSFRLIDKKHFNHIVQLHEK